MASNEYYNNRPTNPDSLPSHPSHPRYEQETAYTPDPAPYSSNLPYPSSDAPPGRHDTQPRYDAPSRNDTVSPFATPFDDRVYPMGRPTNTQYDSQTSIGGDSRYYGQADRPQDSTGSFRDDIPLQPQKPQIPPKDHYQNDNDHVYDAPPRPTHLEAGRPGGTTPTYAPPKKSKWKIAWVCYIFGTVQLAVFIAELVRNAQLTGTPIAIKPQFNPMIGPSPQVQINMGGRYMPCMHKIRGIQGRTSKIDWFCPNQVDASVNECTLTQLCGFSNSVPNPKYDGDFDGAAAPNQWFRFIIPMFMHAGIIHIGFNMLLQFTLGREMEIAIGSVRFLLVYVASGIFGFVLGGNLAAEGIVSTGASGALFGVLALVLLDLLYSWKERRSPGKDLAFILLDIVISFILGLLPGLDNYSHIGGFLMGLVLGICILHSPNALRKRIQEDEPPYTPVAAGYQAAGPGQYAGAMRFIKSPLGFFKGRKPAWWVWWLVRAGCLVAVLVVFIVLLNNFYNPNRGKCGWCKHLSCIDINNWCDIGNLKFEEHPATKTVKRALESWESVARRVNAI